MGRTCSAHVLLVSCTCSFHGNSVNNLLSYCGLVDARISASEKCLPVLYSMRHLQSLKSTKTGQKVPKCFQNGKRDIEEEFCF